MAIGLRIARVMPASTSCLFFALCIGILGNFLVTVQARPMNSDGTPPISEEDWAAEVDWLGPEMQESKTWRAFDPSKAKSTNPWWQDEMNDQLWDPYSTFQYPDYVDNYDSSEVYNYNDDDDDDDTSLVDKESKEEDETSKLGEKVQNTDDNKIENGNQISDNEEDDESQVSSKEEDDNENDSDSTMTDDSSFASPYIGKADIESFVDPGPGGFYSQSLGEKTYEPGYRMQPYINDFQNDAQKVAEPAQEAEDLSTADETKAAFDAPDVPEGGDRSKEEEDKASQSNEEESSEIQEDKVELASFVASKLMAGNDEDSEEIANTENVMAENEESKPKQGKDEKEANENTAENIVEKEDRPIVEENNAYGKGESIPQLKSEPSSEELNVQPSKKEETSLDKQGQFEDWADWDDSAFDDYDDDDSSNESDDEDSSTSDDEDDSSDDYDDDEDEDDDEEDDSDDDSDDDDDESTEDYYDDEEDEDDSSDEDDDADEYDDDEDDDSEDEDDASDEKYSDEHDSTEKDDEKIVEPSPVEQPKIPESPIQSETDKLDLYQADDANGIAFDDSHYNKGTIYDFQKPFHTSTKSVKKDLTNPANHKAIPLVPALSQEQVDSKEQLPAKYEDENTKNEPLEPKASASSKKDSDVNHVQAEGLSTGLESLTSPNPRPTVHSDTWSDTSQSSTNPSPSPTAWPSTHDIMMGDGPSLDDDIYVNSHPLEHCKVDYECRAGRTCVEGVCKCVKASFCAGHYKPVCGSDGIQYPSHCELHRSACLNRMHIRIDRRGKCFGDDFMPYEKSWLIQQEKFLVEGEEKEEDNGDNSITLESEKISEYLSGAQNDKKGTEVKKAYPTMIAKKPRAIENCTLNEMSKFKNDLLMFYCNKFVEPNCKLEVRTDRQYLSMLMFSYYDNDFDFYLTADELDDKERDEDFDKNLIKNCHLRKFVEVADTEEADGLLTVSEFTNAFELTPTAPTKNDMEIRSTLASAGDGLELACGVHAEKIIWKRYKVQLRDDQKRHKLMVFDDGSLFISELGVHHIGNYTCMNAEDETQAQTHRLNIQTKPVVELTPVKQTIVSGSDIVLRCHSEGVPEPQVTWKFGGKEIHNTDRTVIFHGQDHILIHNAEFGKDNGTYTCSSHNQAGTTEMSVNVNILPPNSNYDMEVQEKEGSFVVFHDKGIKIYDPNTCLARRIVPNDFGNFKFIPDAMDSPLTLCKDGQKCQWADAVRVGFEYIYISQPDQNRILVMEAGNYWNPLQVIDTDREPKKLLYVPHLDQVWVLCKSEEVADNDKTIMVIRDASQPIQHRSVHTRPVGNHFDTVKDLFIAPPNDLHHEFHHGYVSHFDKYSLTKISLEDMSYSKTIDLSNYGCVPQNLAFMPLAGRIIIQCVSEADQHTLQLVMDYLTDAIVSTTTIPGQPIVSPDARHLVTVDKFTGKIVVVSVSNEGEMETTYEVTVSASISDVAFMPSIYHHGYDLILTSADDDDVIIMNLVTGRVEKMQGSNLSDPSQPWHPSPVFRHIISGDPTSNLLMSPAKSSLSILNLRFRQVECEFIELTGNQVMVHVPAPHIG